MNDIELLGNLFAGVTLPSEAVGKGGGRELISAGRVGQVEAGPISEPARWLLHFNIPIRECQKEELRINATSFASALFCQESCGGAHLKAEVRIAKGYDLDNPKDRWTVWHEAGHAADFVFTREGKLIATPHGQFSTNHIEVMRQHQDVIITWSPHSDRAYKIKPEELWAECVACAIIRPSQMPPDLLAALRPDLERLHFPIGTVITEAQIAVVKPEWDKMQDFLGRPKALDTLGFIGGQQLACVRDLMRGEEGDFFREKMVELARVVDAMPKTGETDGQGEDAIVHIHYFAGSQANWYITEKDVGCADDEPSDLQSQAFGKADLFGDGGELGYISIAEIIANNGELDFHWTPKPLKEIS